MKLKMTMATLGLAMVATAVSAQTITYKLGYSWDNPGYLVDSAVDSLGNEQWSDGQPAHAGADYAIGASQHMLTTKDILADTVFPGESLIIGTTGTSYWDGRFQNLTIDKFELVAGTKHTICAYYGWASHLVMRFKGSLWTLNDRSILEIAHNNYDQQFVFEMPLAGTGTFQILGYSVDLNWPALVTADNSAFKGAIKLADMADGNLNVLEVSNPVSLGGAPDAFLPDALPLGDRCGLKVTETMSLDVENRGVSIGNAYVEVAAGKTLAVKEPIRIVSADGFAKKGEGTLALGSTVTFGADGAGVADGNNSKLLVEAGTFRPLTAEAAANLDLVFADGAALSLDAGTSDAGLAANGLTCRSLTAEGARLDVTFDFTGGKGAIGARELPICTVPAAEAAELADKLAITTKGVNVAAMPQIVRADAGNGMVRLSAQVDVLACNLVVPRQSDGSFAPVAVPASAFGDFGVRLVNGGAAIAELDAPYLVARVAADAPDVTARDFTYEGFAPSLRHFTEVTVEGAVGGERQVYVTIRMNEIAYSVAASWDNIGYLMDKAKASNGENVWSNGLASHGGADYLLGGYMRMEAGDYTAQAGVFPGRQLTVDSWDTCYIEQRTYDLTILNFVAAAGKPTFCMNGKWDSTSEYRLIGDRWSIHDAALSIVTGNLDQQIVLEARLEGPGQIVFTGGNNHFVGDKGGWSVMASTNVNFKGRVIVNVSEDDPPATDHVHVLNVAHPLSLGGAMDAFNAEALRLEAASGIKATETMTLATINRGITIADGFLEVVGGKTLTVREPICLTGVKGFFKYGAGTLALGGDFTFGDGAARALAVREGSIQPLSGAVSKLAVSFEAGTALVLDLEASDPLVAARGFDQPDGFSIMDEKLPVRIAVPPTTLLTDDVEVAVCTVPSADAEGLLSRLLVSCVGGAKRHHVNGLSTRSAGEGLTTVVATVGGPKGLVLTIK